jgi:hypothetical protein
MQEHKGRCEEALEKLVNRVGESLREIFFVFSERAFSTKVSAIVKGSDVIMISEGSNDVRKSRQVLFAFPMMLTPDVRDRQAVLSASRSEHAIGFLHGFLAQMLQGELSRFGVVVALILITFRYTAVQG